MYFCIEKYYKEFSEDDEVRDINGIFGSFKDALNYIAYDYKAHYINHENYRDWEYDCIQDGKIVFRADPNSYHHEDVRYMLTAYENDKLKARMVFCCETIKDNIKQRCIIGDPIITYYFYPFPGKGITIP